MRRSQNSLKLLVFGLIIFSLISTLVYLQNNGSNNSRPAENLALADTEPETIYSNPSELILGNFAGKAKRHPKFSYTVSFYTVPHKNANTELLCKLNVTRNCQITYVSEVIESFWIVSPIYSMYQARNSIRYELHANFQEYVKRIGLSACTFEALRKGRGQEYIMTQAGNEPYEIQGYIFDDIYIRENLINVAAKMIPDWEYIAWIDAHHMFDNVYWWEDAIIDMEKIGSIQLFQSLSWHGWSNETWWTRPGALYASILRKNITHGDIPYFGNAYSVRREVHDQLGYVLDTCIGGCCDCSYVKASLDNDTAFDYMSKQWPEYTKQMQPWIDNATKIFAGKRKGVRGDVAHLPHENSLMYFSLMNYLNDNDFNVDEDICRYENFTIYLCNKRLKTVINFFGFYANYKVEFITGCVVAGVALLSLVGYVWWRLKKGKKIGTTLSEVICCRESVKSSDKLK